MRSLHEARFYEPLPMLCTLCPHDCRISEGARSACSLPGPASILKNCVGFATKDLVASLVAGLLVMFDRPFQVGDRVWFGGEYGDVLAIGLRSV